MARGRLYTTCRQRRKQQVQDNMRQHKMLCVCSVFTYRQTTSVARASQHNPASPGLLCVCPSSGCAHPCVPLSTGSCHLVRSRPDTHTHTQPPAHRTTKHTEGLTFKRYKLSVSALPQASCGSFVGSTRLSTRHRFSGVGHNHCRCCQMLTAMADSVRCLPAVWPDDFYMPAAA